MLTTLPNSLASADPFGDHRVQSSQGALGAAARVANSRRVDQVRRTAHRRAALSPTCRMQIPRSGRRSGRMPRISRPISESSRSAPARCTRIVRSAPNVWKVQVALPTMCTVLAPVRLLQSHSGSPVALSPPNGSTTNRSCVLAWVFNIQHGTGAWTKKMSPARALAGASSRTCRSRRTGVG